ncbi:MAG: response regulator [Rhodocyclaceae bacterium]|nr:response regulator [Rhodocyclaceae bacterium]
MNATEILFGATREILLLIDSETLKIVAANPAAGRLGYAQDQLLGMPISELECALSDLFFWDEIRAAPADITAVSSYRCADGDVIEVEKTVRSVLDISGNCTHYTVAITPSSSHNEIAGALTDLGSRLAATLEATADGILLIDRTGSILNMNRRFATLWKIPPDLLIETNEDAIIDHVRAQVAYDDDTREFREISPQSDEETFDTLHLHDGRIIERTSMPARNDVQIIGRVFSYRDVTELVAAREEANRASRAKSDFLAMMSHEIRTPMNGVLGIAELLALTPLNDEQAAYLRTIRSSGEVLMSILNGILDYSKIDAGKLRIEQTEVDLAALLDDLTQLFRPAMNEKNLAFQCAIDPDVPGHILADPIRLRQILINLIGNAGKFTETGSIKVQIRRNETARLHFSVTDSGIGIPADRIDSVFTAFEQAEASTTRRFGGTGLGLSICQKLVHLMEGEIGVESVHGKGSTFWFTLPLRATNVSRSATSPEQASDDRLLDGMRILVVDDNRVNLALLGGMLKKLGTPVITFAHTGREAIGHDTGQLDLILMDTQMPEMDGLDATRHLRAQGCKLPIVGVSAGALEEERNAALSSGMDGYILKPLTFASLREGLQRVLTTRLPGRS